MAVHSLLIQPHFLFLLKKKILEIFNSFYKQLGGYSNDENDVEWNNLITTRVENDYNIQMYEERDGHLDRLISSI